MVVSIVPGPSSHPHLTTTPQTLTVADALTGWSKELSAAQFDPSLGTLDSVNITLTGDETASVAAENLGATAATLGFSETPTLTLVTPDPNTYVRATPTVTDGMTLAAYDGSEDFAGTSGQTEQGLTATAQTTAELTSTQDLAAFTGDGSITLPMYAFGASSLAGPADLLTQLADRAGATISISYTYTPAETETLVELATRAVLRRRHADRHRARRGRGRGTCASATLVRDGAGRRRARRIIWIGRREVDCAAPSAAPKGLAGAGRRRRVRTRPAAHATCSCRRTTRSTSTRC